MSGRTWGERQPLTDEQVKEDYLSDSGRFEEDSAQDFDVWLAKVKADAWQKAYGQGKYDGLYGFTTVNPYRKGTSE